MTDDRPFTKDDAATLGSHLEKLFDAKLETTNERITGLKNWVMALVAAAVLATVSTAATHQTPAHNATTIAQSLISAF